MGVSTNFTTMITICKRREGQTCEKPVVKPKNWDFSLFFMPCRIDKSAVLCPVESTPNYFQLIFNLNK